MSSKQQIIEDDSIDLVALFRQIYGQRRLIIKSALLGLVLGIVVALLTPNQYSAATVFIPNYGSSSGDASGLKGLASLAGFDLGGMESGSKELSPMLYGQILQGVSFNKALLKAQIKTPESTTTLEQYLLDQNTGVLSTIKEYTIGLPGKILSLFKNETESLLDSGLETITEQEFELIKQLSELITLNVNDKDGYIELSSTLKDPLVAAQITTLAKDLLQQEIIEIKTRGAKELVTYLSEQFEDKKADLNAAQDALSSFRDQNLSISSYRFSNVQTRLETDLSIATGVFQNVSSQLEAAKLQVEKDTPVFSIIKPVVVPVEKSAPKRSLVVVIWVFIALVLSIGYALVKDPAKQIFKEIQKEQ